MAFDRILMVCVDTPISDINDLALVDRLSGGKVDLTYGRCVLDPKGYGNVRLLSSPAPLISSVVLW